MNSNTFYPYHYLIFGGGGAAGIAHAGAIQQLSRQKEFSFSKLKAVGGTSIGSIAALLVALHYTPSQIMQKLLAFDLTKVADSAPFPHNLFQLYARYGFYRGHVVYQLILDLIKEKTGRADPENVTFRDIEKLGYINLHVVTTKLYTLNGYPTGKRKIFSAENTPETPIAATILASCSAPLYFERVRLKKVAKGKYILSKDGDLYNDGGVISNLAIDLFDKQKYVKENPEKPNATEFNPHVIALTILDRAQIIDSTHIPSKGEINDKNPSLWGNAIYNTMTSRNEVNGIEKADKKRLVQIDRLGISLAHFDIDEKTKMALVESGRDAVKRFFSQPAYGRMWAPKKVANDQQPHFAKVPLRA